MRMRTLACRTVAGFAAGLIAGVALSQFRTGAAHLRRRTAGRKTVQEGDLPGGEPGQQTMEADRLETTQTPVKASGKREQHPGNIKDRTEPARPNEPARPTEPARPNEPARPAKQTAPAAKTKRPRDGQTKTQSGQTAPEAVPGRGGGKRARSGVQDLTKEQLYQEARKRNIRGRSTMTKAELRRALR